MTRRRDFLKRSWKWALALLTILLIHPLARFINFTTRSRPRYVEIRKPLRAGEFAVAREFILFVDENGPWAVSRKCTHLGCRVNYLEEQTVIECPCHQSRFTPRGIRLSGPARKNLPIFPVEKLSGKGDDQAAAGYLVTL